jgi:hypothetical protein
MLSDMNEHFPCRSLPCGNSGAQRHLPKSIEAPFAAKKTMTDQSP